MSLKAKKIQVLKILSENLNNPRPELVRTSVIAGQLNLQLTELQYVLKTMDGMGVIQTDPDLQYNLITRKGLLYLDQQRTGV